MNRINFIRPIILVRKNEIRIWYWLCTICIIVLFFIITITSSMQWYLYRTLTTQKNELLNELSAFTTITTQHRTHLDELKQVQKQLDTINRYKTNPQNPLSLLKIVRKATSGMTLQTATINKHHFELHVLCASATQAVTCMKKLNQESSLHNVMLTSLLTHQDKVQVTIKGNITTKLRDV